MRIITILSAILLPLLLGAVTPEQQRKADYYFLESLSRYGVGETDAMYLLLRRSVELDSISSVVPVGRYGRHMMAISRGDSTLYNTGLHLLERRVTADPTDLYDGFNLALNYEQLGRFDSALKVWQMLDSLNPDNSSLILHRAAVEGRYGSPEEAIRLMQRVETIDGSHPQIVMPQVQLMLGIGDTVKACERVESMLASMPTDADVRVFAAMFQEQIGNFAKADSLVDEAIALDPSNGSAYYQRAMRFKRQGQAEQYHSELLRTLELDAIDVEDKLGYVYKFIQENLNNEDLHPLIDRMFGVLQLQYPHHDNLCRLAGGYYAEVDDYARAAEFLTYVVDMNHDDAQLWDSLVRLYASCDSIDKAVAVAREAIGYLPENASLHHLLGMVQSQSGDYRGAIATLRQTVALTDSADIQTRSEVLTTIGDVWQLVCETDSAAAAYEEAIAINPDNDLALNNYAYFLAEQNRELSKAEKMSQRSMQLRPFQPTYIDTYAWIMFRLGEYQKAKEFIDTALLAVGDNKSAELLEHYADIVFKLGRTEQALEYWKEALSLDPDNERIQQKVETGKID